MVVENAQERRTRTQKRVRRTRRRLKEAALDVFSEKSIDAATVEEIAEKADLGKGTLYQHFSDKEDFAVAVIEDAIRHLTEVIRSYDSRPRNLEAMLRHLIDSHYRFHDNAAEEFMVLFQGRLLLQLRSKSYNQLEDPYLRYLAELQDQIKPYFSGRGAKEDSRTLACALAGFVSGYLSFSLIAMTAKRFEKDLQALADIFVSTLVSYHKRLRR